MLCVESTRSLWHNPGFVKLWAGQTVSSLGAQVSLVALPLTAVVYLHASAFAVGLLTAVETLAYLIAGVPSGPLADRSHKRTVLIFASVGRAVALGSVPLSAAFGVAGMPLLYGVAFVVGLLTMPFDIACQSYVPKLVDDSRLIEGSSKFQASASATQIVGPSLAGVLVGAITAPFAVLIDAVSHVGSALLIRSIPAATDVPARSYRRNVTAGFNAVIQNPILIALAACSATIGLFEGIDGAVIVVYLTRTLRASPQYVGLVFSLCAIGGLLGALFATRLARRFGSARTLIASVGLGCPFALLTVAAQPGWSTILIGVGSIPLWFGLVVYNTIHFGYRQRLTRPDLRGRVNATMQVIANAPTPLGALIGGLLGEWIGLRGTLTVSAIGLSLAVCFLLASPVRRSRELAE